MATVGARATSAAEYVTDEMRRQFREDGVVHLRQALEPTWREFLARF